MSLEIEICSVSQPPKFFAAKRIIKFQVNRALAVVSAVADWHFEIVDAGEAKRLPESVHLGAEKLESFFPFSASWRRDEIFDLHLLELARPEKEIARGDFVAEGPADLSDAEGQFRMKGVHHIFEIDEHPLRRLGTEIGNRSLVRGSDLCLEHQIKLF